MASTAQTGPEITQAGGLRLIRSGTVRICSWSDSGWWPEYLSGEKWVPYPRSPGPAARFPGMGVDQTELYYQGHGVLLALLPVATGRGW